MCRTGDYIIRLNVLFMEERHSFLLESSALQRNRYSFLFEWRGPTCWTAGSVFWIQAPEVHRCSTIHNAKSKESLEEMDDLEILASADFQGWTFLFQTQAGGWAWGWMKEQNDKKGWEDEWIATDKEGRVSSLSLNLSLMDGWKEGMGKQR